MKIISTNKTRYILSRYLRKMAQKLTPRESGDESITFPSLGMGELSSSSPKALIIYSATGIDRYVRGVSIDDQIFNKHTIYWESVEMVKILNKKGFVVDYCDVWKPFKVDWSKYSIIIDNLDNLKNVGPKLGIKKVYWATNNHWLEWNSSELKRIKWFKERTGIVIPANRQMPSILSDEYADYLTYFGTNLQAESFNPQSQKRLINISSCTIPPYQKKNIGQSKNKFLLISGGGAIHKGIDLVIEAFAKIPEAELFMVANLKEEPRFYNWAAPIMSKHENIHEMGWYDLASKDFDLLADQCIGTVFLSCAEGGPGSIARVLHNGLIPISTPSSFVRAEHLGYQIQGDSDAVIINNTINAIHQIMTLSDSELLNKSDSVREFALKNHTREAFSESFSNFIEKL